MRHDPSRVLETFCNKGTPLLGASALYMAAPPGPKAVWSCYREGSSLHASCAKRGSLIAQSSNVCNENKLCVWVWVERSYDEKVSDGKSIQP